MTCAQTSLEQLILNYTERDVAQRDIAFRFLALINEYPDCFDRTCMPGHLTASSWLLGPHGKVLLTHHRKLGIWIQPGGHADGCTDLLEVALKEAQEESGLELISALSPEIFDLDIHDIPAYGDQPPHQHFDVRFLLRAADKDFKVSSESFDLAWVDPNRLSQYTEEVSLLRMAEKWCARANGELSDV